MQPLKLNSSSCCILTAVKPYQTKMFSSTGLHNHGLNWFEYVGISENHNQWLGFGVQSLESKSTQWFDPDIAIFRTSKVYMIILIENVFNT